MRRRHVLRLFLSMVTGLISGVSVVWADTSNPLSAMPSAPSAASSGPGAGLYQYIAPQLMPIFILFVGVMALVHFFRQRHTKLVVLIISATIVGVLVFEPQALGGIIGWVSNGFEAITS